ncbi:glutathione-dependent formaldehyde dehydrogenase [Sesbania bispinosa]|nr:glutathione-dependent formaldehyde dehydrogenase [Sesbania bispinosa]
MKTEKVLAEISNPISNKVSFSMRVRDKKLMMFTKITSNRRHQPKAGVRGTNIIIGRVHCSYGITFDPNPMITLLDRQLDCTMKSPQINNREYQLDELASNKESCKTT